MKQNRNKIKREIVEAKNIVITAHVSPDGDAIGSTLGLFHYLKQLNSNVKVLVPNAFPSFLAWLPDSDQIELFEGNEEYATELLANASLLFCLDFNETSRTAFMKEAIDDSPAFKVLIDHHIGEPSWPNINLSVVGASSTCELVLDFIHELHGDYSFLNTDIAYCLYTGLLTDTGNFQYSATTAKVHHQAAYLIDAGVQPDVVHNHINNSYNKQRLQFFGFCVSERMEIVKEKKLAYMLLSAQDMHNYNIQTGGTEGLVNEPMKIAEIDISVMFKEDVDKVKISFRSKKDIDISAFARKYFNGGGHRNAAGGVSYKSLADTETYFLQCLEDFSL